jgi:hypothetical protein
MFEKLMIQNKPRKWYNNDTTKTELEGENPLMDIDKLTLCQLALLERISFGSLMDITGYYETSGSKKNSLISKTIPWIIRTLMVNPLLQTELIRIFFGGYFDMEHDYRMSFTESFVKKMVLQSLRSGDYSDVYAEDIIANQQINTSRFDGKAWIPVSRRV